MSIVSATSGNAVLGSNLPGHFSGGSVGWQCPNCGRGCAPSTMYCCQPSTSTVTKIGAAQLSPAIDQCLHKWELTHVITSLHGINLFKCSKCNRTRHEEL